MKYTVTQRRLSSSQVGPRGEPVFLVVEEQYEADYVDVGQDGSLCLTKFGDGEVTAHCVLALPPTFWFLCEPHNEAVLIKE